jgi:hypothetical protein
MNADVSCIAAFLDSDELRSGLVNRASSSGSAARVAESRVKFVAVYGIGRACQIAF